MFIFGDELVVVAQIPHGKSADSDAAGLIAPDNFRAFAVFCRAEFAVWV